MTNSNHSNYLKNLNLNDHVIEEVLNYTENKFKRNANLFKPNNLFLEFWNSYKLEASDIGIIQTLKQYYYQFLFPVEEGISKSIEYRNATLKGLLPVTLNEHQFNEPENIKLDIYNSPLGERTPVLTVFNEDDFNNIVRVFCYKNEPQMIPKSMGAIFVNGINNWHRIEKLKSAFLAQNSIENWPVEFKNNIIPNHHLYKDKLVILSAKPYSGITHKKLGISESSWLKSSIEIRREHECAHLFTLEYYNHMAKNMHDELVADYVGISKVLGNFDKQWFYYFVGIANYPNYTINSRLENYLPENFTSDAFKAIMSIVHNAAFYIEGFDKSLGPIKNNIDWLNRIKTICETDLLDMCQSNAKSILLNKYKSIQQSE